MFLQDRSILPKLFYNLVFLILIFKILPWVREKKLVEITACCSTAMFKDAICSVVCALWWEKKTLARPYRPLSRPKETSPFALGDLGPAGVPGQGSKQRAFRVTASTRSPRGPYLPWASPAGPHSGADRGREGSPRCAGLGSKPLAPAPRAGATLERWSEIKSGKVLHFQIGEAQLGYRRVCRVSRRVCSNCLNCFKALESERPSANNS